MPWLPHFGCFLVYVRIWLHFEMRRAAVCAAIRAFLSVIFLLIVELTHKLSCVTIY